ncbi:hypothetical protein Asp14428_35430 [Actinoplanes sp. NBRC 14428]|nr:hypothetical protein Asp14428_35430 [Actinoplanes sp. NBRC 14428]
MKTSRILMFVSATAAAALSALGESHASTLAWAILLTVNLLAAWIKWV